MNGWTGYFMDWIKDGQTKINTLWTGPMKGNTERILYGLASRRERQTGYFMDCFTDGQTDWIHVLYGLAHGQMGWILIFMDWPTNGTTLQVATILVAMAPKILKLAT